MKFSAVIVNYDSWPHTLRCVGALLGTEREALEVLVVDNEGGPPPRLPRSVTLIRNPTNEGFARACNKGIEASNGDCVVLVNPDTLVEKDFFDLLEKFFAADSEVGIAGPRIIDGDGRRQLSARREVGFASGLLGRTSFLTRLFPKSAAVRRMFPTSDALNGPRKVDWVSGACLAVRREVLEKIGGLDGRFFMYFEDADLCRRSREAGRPVYYLPRVEVIHITGASSRSKLRAVWRLHKSAFLYHRKHGPHGPMNFYSVLVLCGLAVRASVKLATLRFR